MSETKIQEFDKVEQDLIEFEKELDRKKLNDRKMNQLIGKINESVSKLNEFIQEYNTKNWFYTNYKIIKKECLKHSSSKSWIFLPVNNEWTDMPKGEECKIGQINAVKHNGLIYTKADLLGFSYNTTYDRDSVHGSEISSSEKEETLDITWLEEGPFGSVEQQPYDDDTYPGKWTLHPNDVELRLLSYKEDNDEKEDEDDDEEKFVKVECADIIDGKKYDWYTGQDIHVHDWGDRDSPVVMCSPVIVSGIAIRAEYEGEKEEENEEEENK